eukprot:8068036-Pyramimonas_sp.AAC.1
MKFLGQYLAGGTTMAIQEAHANDIQLRQDLHRFNILHKAFSSFGEKRDTGGVASVIHCPHAAVEHARFVHDVIVPGRVQRLRIPAIPSSPSEACSSIIFYNAHNFGLSSTDMDAIERLLSRDVALAASAPDR